MGMDHGEEMRMNCAAQEAVEESEFLEDPDFHGHHLDYAMVQRAEAMLELYLWVEEVVVVFYHSQVSDYMIYVAKEKIVYAEMEVLDEHFSGVEMVRAMNDDHFDEVVAKANVFGLHQILAVNEIVHGHTMTESLESLRVQMAEILSLHDLLDKMVENENKIGVGRDLVERESDPDDLGETAKTSYHGNHLFVAQANGNDIEENVISSVSQIVNDWTDFVEISSEKANHEQAFYL